MMNKEIFIKLILSARNSLDAVLLKFTREQMEIMGDSKQWSAKDVIAHIGWYESEMVNLLRQHKLEGSEWWNLPLQERNAAIHLATRNEELNDVIANEAQTYMMMLELLEELDEPGLNDPMAFKGMPSDWQPWSVIASNTNEHYLDHIDQLEKLLTL
ncbi:MAG: ClbS/DfsB family four-helix bundle protein [Chloroflexota bacterium]